MQNRLISSQLQSQTSTLPQLRPSIKSILMMGVSSGVILIAIHTGWNMFFSLIGRYLVGFVSPLWFASFLVKVVITSIICFCIGRFVARGTQWAKSGALVCMIALLVLTGYHLSMTVLETWPYAGVYIAFLSTFWIIKFVVGMTAGTVGSLVGDARRKA